MAKYWAHHLSIWSHWPYLSFATKSTSIVRFWQFWPWTMLRVLTMLMLLLLLQLLLLLLLLQLLLLLLLLQLLLLQLLMVDGLVKVVQEVGDQGRDDKQDEASVRHFWKLKDRLNCQSIWGHQMRIFKLANPDLSFICYRLFNTVDSSNTFCRCLGLCCQKQPFYQLSYNHCPNAIILGAWYLVCFLLIMEQK